MSLYALALSLTLLMDRARPQVTDVFPLEDYQGALDKMNSRGALKIAIKP